MNVRKRLFELKDEKYKEFNSSLLPNVDKIIGVRVPDVRKIAKELAKTNQKYKGGLYYEEKMLQGLLIGYAQLDLHERLKLLEEFVPKIDNWGVCDVVCSNLKFTKQNKAPVWEFIQQYLNSDKEFEIRFGVVMLLDYFIEDEYIDDVLRILDGIRHEGYYAKMAVAWAISICFVKYWEKTFKYFKNSNLSAWILNKSIQKTCESFRITDKQKNLLRKFKSTI